MTRLRNVRGRNICNDPFDFHIIRILSTATIGHVRCGSWLCENALTEARTRHELSQVAIHSPYFGFDGISDCRRSCCGLQRSWAVLQWQMDAGRRRLCSHRRHERLDTDDVHDAREIVGQHVQRHFGGNTWQRLHQEVGCAHPGLDRSEGMLDRLAPLAHLFWMFVEPALHRLKNVLVLPSGDPA